MLLSQEQISKTENLELLARQVVEGFITGLHKSPFHGFSVEFAEHRIYNTGESTRNIDWKLFARTDKLFVKRYEEETNLRCQLVIDNSSSMYYPAGSFSKLNFSVYAAASLIYLLKRQRDSSGISIVNETIEFHSQSKSNSVHLKLLFNKLEQLRMARQKPLKSNLAANLHQIAELLHKRSMVIIFSDMLDTQVNQEELASALQHLRYNKHEVILFHITDRKTEVAFDFENRPYLFTDSESGEKIKLFPNQIKDSYIQQSEQFRHELKLKCARYKIELIEAEVGNDFSQILLPFLVKRGKLF